VYSGCQVDFREGGVKTADRILARELVDYAKTDKLLEWQRLIPWINNFAQKKAKGKFQTALAVKALGDHVARDVLLKYLGSPRGGTSIRLDADTKLLFGRTMLQYLMPRINRTAERMRKVGLNKGRLSKPHPHYPHIRH
jgi:hypothetical protein